MRLSAWFSLSGIVFICFSGQSGLTQEQAPVEPKSGNIQIIRNARETVLVISGVEPVDKNDRVIAEEEIGGQMKQALENLRRIAIRAGALPAQIVTITIFTTAGNQAEVLKTIPRDLFRDWSPAVSVEERRLGKSGALVELEAVAIVRDAKPH